MKVVKFLFWLIGALTIGLSPIWAVIFGFCLIGIFLGYLFSEIIISPMVLVLFIILFLLSMIASHAQYGRVVRETAINAPPPANK